MDKLSKRNINKVFNMDDSSEKLNLITDLVLEAEYLTPLWRQLYDEERRLLDAGFEW